MTSQKISSANFLVQVAVQKIRFAYVSNKLSLKWSQMIATMTAPELGVVRILTQQIKMGEKNNF